MEGALGSGNPSAVFGKPCQRHRCTCFFVGTLTYPHRTPALEPFGTGPTGARRHKSCSMLLLQDAAQIDDPKPSTAPAC